MGTILSSIPIICHYHPVDDYTLDQSFERGLKNAVNGKWSLDTVEARPQVEDDARLANPSLQGIFRKNSLVSAAMSETNTRSKEYSKTQITSRPPAIAGKHTKSSNASVNGITSLSKKSLDINKNPSITEKNSESTKALQTLNAENANQAQQQTTPKKPFQPESWPTLEMLQEILHKHKTLPTTLIFARFLANRHAKKYVEIRYSTTENTNETFLDSSDKLETLITAKDEFKKGDTKEDEIKYFLLIFKTCINNLQGQVWWNGYSLVLDSNVKNRLKVLALETQPISQLLFELTGMKELEVHRTLHRIEMRGEVEGNPENTPKYIRFRAATVTDIKIKQLRGNLITVHIPSFAPEIIAYLSKQST